MKTILRLFAAASLCLMFAANANAQLPNGSVAPDFTAMDIDGNEHTLSEYLEQGIPVVIDFSATWCGPCWNYHTGVVSGTDGEGALHHLYNEYGPDGTGEVMVFFIEGDDETGMDDLEGTTAETQGNWIEDTPYPIIDDAEDISDEYEVPGFPTIYTVCPSGYIYETGQISSEMHIDFIRSVLCEAATDVMDPAISGYSGATATCGEFDATVDLFNLGTENLMSATIEATGCDNCPIEQMWTGDLATYGIEQVDFEGLIISSDSDVSFTITDMNDDTENDSYDQAVAMATEGTTAIKIDISFDCWPEEVGWMLYSDGNLVASAAEGTYAAQTAGSSISETHWVPQGCMEFVITDGFGDGMAGSVWQECDIDGSCKVSTINDDASEYSVIYEYLATYFYGIDGALGLITQTVGVDEDLVVADSFNVFPNPVYQTANVNFSVAAASEVTVDVMNMLGQTVISEDMGTVVAGEHRTQLDFAALEAGIYMVNLTANGEVSTIKVTVAH